MKRDDARKVFEAAGLTYEHLSQSRLQRLRKCINDEMIKSGLIKGTFRCKQRAVYRPDDGYGLTAFINCKSFYFDDREAVSFNRDGFIGFAGWADEKNVQPILNGFCKWANQEDA